MRRRPARRGEKIADALRESRDPAAVDVGDDPRALAARARLLALLDEHGLLVEAHGVDDPWLASLGPDPDQAAARVAAAAARVTGNGELADEVARAIAETGVETRREGVERTLAVLVGTADDLDAADLARRPVAVAVLDCDGAYLVADITAHGIDTVTAAARRVAAARHRPAPGRTLPAAMLPALAAATAADLLLDLLVDTPQRATARLVSPAATREVTLVAPLWLHFPTAAPAWHGPWQERDDRHALDALEPWFDPATGALDEPLPDTLPQLPLALNRVWLDGLQVIGSGTDHDSARTATALHALRHLTKPAAGKVRAAGVGPLDFLADALGRLAADGAVLDATPVMNYRGHPARWAAAIRQDSGQLPYTLVGRARRVPGLFVAVSRITGRIERGFGATPEQAVEHVLRQLLTRLHVPTSARQTCAAAHLPALAPALVRAAAGLADDAPTPSWPGLLALLTERIPGMELQLLEPAEGFARTGLILGDIWSTS